MPVALAMNRLVYNTPCRLKQCSNPRSNRYARFQIASCLAGLGVVLLAALLATPFDFTSLNKYLHVEPAKVSDFKKTDQAGIRLMASRIAREENVEPELVLAIIKVESEYNIKARSRAGAQGLMQLMPATAREMKVIDPFDPEHNIRGGVMYLSRLLDRYDGNRKNALAAYNAGPGVVDRHRGIPPYSETQSYVKRVLKEYKSEKALKTTAYL